MRLLVPFSFAMTLLFAVPSQAQRQLKVENMSANNCRVIDHNTITGDDSGGIAVSSDKLYYNGDTGTGQFNLNDLGGGRRLGRNYSLISNLANGKVYALWNRQANSAVSTSTSYAGGTFDALKELDANLSPTNTTINLSQGITLTRSYSTTGHLLLSGFHAMGIGTYQGRFYVVDFNTGEVTDVGPRGGVRAYQCESWAKWGVLEYFDNNWFALFRTYGAQSISRVAMGTGNGGAVFNFQRLSDMCSITVSPDQQRWYFHHEGGSQFGGSSETAGYCGATIVTNSAPEWTLPEPMDVYAGQMIRANVSVVELDGDDMTVSVSGMPDGAMWNQLAGKFRWQPTVADAGEHTIRFTATEIRDDGDDALIGTANLVINVIAVDAPPQFTSVPPQAAVSQGDVFVYELFAVDPEAAGEVTYGLIDGPANMVVEGNTLRWQADIHPGEEVQVRVFAADVDGNRGYQSFAIGVDTHPQAPVAVIVPLDQEVAPGRIQLNGVPSYAMGDRTLRFSWRLVEYPDGITPPPVEGSNTATAKVLLRQKGIYSFALQVNDGELDSASVFVQVSVINVAPVAVVGDDVTFTLSEGNETDLLLDGSDSYDANTEDSIDCIWAQTAGPSDLQIEDANALVTNFTATAPGTYTFSLTCSDGSLESEAASVSYIGSDPNTGGGRPPAPPVPDDSCSATGVSTWLLFGLVALRRRRSCRSTSKNA
ncbi:MAG: hypothetical protein OSB21_03180 [Myxococcota bacterium]|nr:hypothetical protein [Myxococcota bacterium]